MDRQANDYPTFAAGQILLYYFSNIIQGSMRKNEWKTRYCLKTQV